MILLALAPLALWLLVIVLADAVRDGRAWWRYTNARRIDRARQQDNIRRQRMRQWGDNE